MNNFAIDLQARRNYNNRQSADFCYEFLERKLKDKEGNTLSIHICEHTISYTMMPQKSRCIGLRARENEKFMPKIYKEEFKKSRVRESGVDSSVRKSKSRLKRK